MRDALLRIESGIWFFMKRFGGCRTRSDSPATVTAAVELGFVRGRSVGLDVSISVVPACLLYKTKYISVYTPYVRFFFIFFLIKI